MTVAVPGTVAGTPRDLVTPVRPGILAVTAVAPLLWGMTYVVVTELLPPNRPFLVAAVRATSAGLVLAVASPHRPHGWWWLRAAVLGVLNIGAFFVLLFVAAYRLPGGVAATLGSVQPLIAAALGVALLGERIRGRTLASGLLGVTGVALLVLRAGAQVDAPGVAAGIAAAGSMAAGTVLVKRWGRPVSLAAFASWQLLAGGVVLVPLALLVEGLPPSLSGRNVAGMGWFAGSTALAYLLWFRGVAALPVAQVSLLGLVSPLVATVAGWAVLDERLAPFQLVGVALVLAAILLGQGGRDGPRVRTATASAGSRRSGRSRTARRRPAVRGCTGG